MAASKRGRDEYWNGGLAFTDAKRINGGLTLANGSDLMPLPDKIDSLQANICSPEERNVGIVGDINFLENDIGLKTESDHNIDSSVEEEGSADQMDSRKQNVGIVGDINFLENDIGLKTESDHNIDSSVEEEGSADQMDSRKQGELTADRSSQVTLVTSDIGDFTCYDDGRAEFDFFIDQFTPEELGIIMNYAVGDSIPDIMYLDAVHSYVETREVFYGSLWEDDIWQLNEHPVIQNDFALPQPEEFGINGIELHDVWK